MSESQSDIPAPDGPLQTPVQFVPGVGPDRAQLLNRLGIETAHDLLMHVPHSVNDFTDLRPAHKLEKDVEHFRSELKGPQSPGEGMAQGDIDALLCASE